MNRGCVRDRNDSSGRSSSFDTTTGTTYVHAAYGRIELPDQGTPTPTFVHYNQFTAILGTGNWGNEVQVSFDGAPYPEKGPVFPLPRTQVASDRANPENIFITWMRLTRARTGRRPPA
jgi:hypothetical protein